MSLIVTGDAQIDELLGSVVEGFRRVYAQDQVPDNNVLLRLIDLDSDLWDFIDVIENPDPE